MKSSDIKLIRLIASFKLLKAILFLAIGIAAVMLIHADIARVLEHWVTRAGLNPGGHYLGRTIRGAATLTPNKVEDVGVGSLIYAGLFLTEGIGLWLLKRWAEWFSIIITSSLVPVEVYEIHRYANAVKVLVLLLNLAVVGYLLFQVRNKSSDLA